MNLTKLISASERLELYHQGLNDREISECLGMSQTCISSWRRKTGLPRNVTHKHRLRLELYNQGLSDAEIAERTGMAYKAINYWRKSLDLPAHHPFRSVKGCPMEKALTPDQCEQMKLFLSLLVTTADKEPGKKVDVGAFVKAYMKLNKEGQLDSSTGSHLALVGGAAK